MLELESNVAVAVAVAISAANNKIRVRRLFRQAMNEAVDNLRIVFCLLFLFFLSLFIFFAT